MKVIMSVLASTLLFSILVTSEVNPTTQAISKSHQETISLDLPDQHWSNGFID